MMMIKIDGNNYPIPFPIGIRYITAYKASNEPSLLGKGLAQSHISRRWLGLDQLLTWSSFYHCVAEHCGKEDLEMDGLALDLLPDCVVLSQLFNFSKLQDIHQ